MISVEDEDENEDDPKQGRLHADLKFKFANPIGGHSLRQAVARPTPVVLYNSDRLLLKFLLFLPIGRIDEEENRS